MTCFSKLDIKASLIIRWYPLEKKIQVSYAQRLQVKDSLIKYHLKSTSKVFQQYV